MLLAFSPPLRLEAAAQAVESGDLGARSGWLAPDEFGRLSYAFDTVAQTLQRREADLRAGNEHLRASESALAAARRDLQNILDAVPSMIGYWDKGLLNRFANQAYHHWFGREPGQLPGTHLRALLGPALFERNAPHVEAALRGETQTFERSIPMPDGSGFRHSLAHYVADRAGNIIDIKENFCSISGGKAWRGQVCNQGKDGSRYWVGSIVAPFFGADGEVEKYVSIRIDITAGQLAEQRLRASEAFLDRAGQIAGVGGWALDLQSMTVTWSAQTYRLHEVEPGYRPTLETALDFYAPEAREAVQRAVARGIEDGTANRCRRHRRHAVDRPRTPGPDGTARPAARQQPGGHRDLQGTGARALRTLGADVLRHPVRMHGQPPVQRCGSTSGSGDRATEHGLSGTP